MKKPTKKIDWIKEPRTSFDDDFVFYTEQTLFLSMSAVLLILLIVFR